MFVAIGPRLAACEGPPFAMFMSTRANRMVLRPRSRGLRVPHSRAAQQLADLRLAGAAIGTGLQAPADVVDAGRPFKDFGRDLMLSDAEARADDRPNVLAGIERLPCQQRHPRIR